MMTVRAGAVNVTCLQASNNNNSSPVGPSGGSSGSATASSSTDGGSGSVPAYVWALVGLAAAAVVAGAATAVLLVRRRRLRQARSNEGSQKDPERGEAAPGSPAADAAAAAPEEDSLCNVAAASISNDLQDGLWRTRCVRGCMQRPAMPPDACCAPGSGCVCWTPAGPTLLSVRPAGWLHGISDLLCLPVSPGCRVGFVDGLVLGGVLGGGGELLWVAAGAGSW